MSRVLSDGSVIPKYFSPHFANTDVQNDMGMRMGRVTDIYYPTDTGNLSTMFVEYDILVDYTDQYGNYSKVLYPRCKVVSKFGGAADFEFYTYRQSTITPQQLNNLEKGSVVLLLCVNSDRRQGYIVGGVPHNLLSQNPKFKSLALATGINYVWEFNGAVINVNDNGELILKYTGKTNDDGSTNSSVDPDNALSEIIFNDQGELQMSTSDQNFTLISNEDGGFNNINAGGAINLLCNSGNINLKSSNEQSGVQIGEATDAMIKGTTFRNAQRIMDDQMVSQFLTLSDELTEAGANLTLAGTLLIIPIVGSILASPLFIAAGATLAASSAQMSAIATAIDSFEGGSEPYLSDRNNSD